MKAKMETVEEAVGSDARSRIVSAATDLVTSGGSSAATTRAVATAAGLHAPMIYRIFGDRDGLLDAVAEHALTEFVTTKAKAPANADPIEELRNSWDNYVAFGLGNPAIFALMYARPESSSKSMEIGLAALREKVRRVAKIGKLRVSEERAVDLIHAMGTGVVLGYLSTPLNERAEVSAAARETVFRQILDEESPAAPTAAAAAAAALRANLTDITSLTLGERQLMSELLERISNSEPHRSV